MKLNHKITIYIPSTYQTNKPAKIMQYKETKRASIFLAELFGGATKTTATGFYIANNGKIVKEKQNLVYSACDNTSNFSKVIKYAEMLRDKMKQESITVEIDGVMQFI